MSCLCLIYWPLMRNAPTSLGMRWKIFLLVVYRSITEEFPLMPSPQHSPCPGGVCLLKEDTIIFPVSQTQYFVVIFILSSNAIPFSIGLSLVPRHLHNASPVTIPVAVHTHSILAPCLTIFHVSHCYPPSVILQAFNVLCLQSILPIVARITFSTYQSHHFLIKDQKDVPVLSRRVQHLT